MGWILVIPTSFRGRFLRGIRTDENGKFTKDHEQLPARVSELSQSIFELLDLVLFRRAYSPGLLYRLQVCYWTVIVVKGFPCDSEILGGTLEWTLWKQANLRTADRDALLMLQVASGDLSAFEELVPEEIDGSAIAGIQNDPVGHGHVPNSRRKIAVEPIL